MFLKIVVIIIDINILNNVRCGQMFVTSYYWNNQFSLFSSRNQIQVDSLFTFRPPGINKETCFSCFLAPGLQQDDKINLTLKVWPLASLPIL